LAQRAVRAMVVEVRHVLGQYFGEMAAVDDQNLVQQLAADSSDPVPCQNSARNLDQAFLGSG
jgi:hypothetical protein